MNFVDYAKLELVLSYRVRFGSKPLPTPSQTVWNGLKNLTLDFQLEHKSMKTGKLL